MVGVLFACCHDVKSLERTSKIGRLLTGVEKNDTQPRSKWNLDLSFLHFPDSFFMAHNLHYIRKGIDLFILLSFYPLGR